MKLVFWHGTQLKEGGHEHDPRDAWLECIGRAHIALTVILDNRIDSNP